MNKSFVAILIIVGLMLNELKQVQGLTCISGNGISPEGSSAVSLSSSNTEASCAASDSGCFRMTYVFSGKNRYVTLGCFPTDAAAALTALATEQYNKNAMVHVCTTDKCNSSNNVKKSVFALSTLICLSLAKVFGV